MIQADYDKALVAARIDMLSYVRHRLPWLSRAGIEDLVQEAFIKVLESSNMKLSPETFVDEAHVRGFMVRWVRFRIRETKADSGKFLDKRDAGEFEAAALVLGTQHDMALEERLDVLDDAIACLSPADRKYVQDYYSINVTQFRSRYRQNACQVKAKLVRLLGELRQLCENDQLRHARRQLPSCIGSTSIEVAGKVLTHA